MSASASLQSFARAWTKGTLTLNQKVTAVCLLTAVAAASSFSEIVSPDIAPWSRVESFVWGCVLLGICIGTLRRERYAWYLGFILLSIGSVGVFADIPQRIAEYREAGFEEPQLELIVTETTAFAFVYAAMVIFWYRMRAYYMEPGSLPN